MEMKDKHKIVIGNVKLITQDLKKSGFNKIDELSGMYFEKSLGEITYTIQLIGWEK